MIKLSYKDACHTRSQNVKVSASLAQLRKAIGDENTRNNDTGKDWTCETEEGDVFTIYLWNYLGRPAINEVVEWHIGAHSGYVAYTAAEEIYKLIQND